jgi:predicted porin
MTYLNSARRSFSGKTINLRKGKMAAAGAVALSALCASPSYAQTAVTIYGIVDAGFVYNNKVATGATTTGSSLSLASGNLQGSRLGFKGTEDLGGGLKSFFVAESGFNVDTGVSGQGGVLFGRTSVVGLSGGLGQVAFGRQTDFAFTNLSLYTSAGPYAFSTLVNNVHAMNLDRTEGARTNNSIRYDTPASLGNFKGSAIYGMGEQAGTASAGQSMGLAGQYTAGPFVVGLSYFQAKAAAAGGAVATTPSSDTGTVCANVAGNAGDTCLKTTTLVTAYQSGPMLAYASWSQVKQPLAGGATGRTLGGASNDKNDVFDVGMAYNVTTALKLLGSVVLDRASFSGASAGSGRVIQYNLGIDYYLSKRTDLYSMIGSQRTSDMLAPGIFGASGGSNSQTVFVAGMRHTF